MGQTLDQASAEKVDETPSPVSDTQLAGGDCPRCGSPLVNPESLGWCPKCGYSRALEQEDKTNELLTAAKKDPSKVYFHDILEWLRMMPQWAWVLTIGCIAILVGSIMAAILLPANFEDETYFYRALWTTVQYGAGALAVIVAQVWLIFLVGMKDDKLGPLDCFILSSRTWKNAWRRLPETRWPFWLIAWSMLAIAGARIIGGFAYWYTYLPGPQQEVDPLLAHLVKEGQDEEKTLEEGIKDFTEDAGVTGEEDEDDPLKKRKIKTPAQMKRQKNQAVVVGYTTNENDQIDGLVVAAVYQRDFSLHYAGVVRYGAGLREHPDTDPRIKPTNQDRARARRVKEVLDKLPELKIDRPQVPGIPAMDATWVKPEVFCLLASDGVREGTDVLDDPILVEFVKSPE